MFDEIHDETREYGLIERWLTHAWSPSLPVIVSTAVVAFLLPIFLHLYLYQSRTITKSPTFIIIGPSGAGKTALLTSLQSGKPSATHTSQTPSKVEVSLPAGKIAASAQHRSPNDPSLATHRKFQVLDTPGHGKLRHHALDRLAQLPQEQYGRPTGSSSSNRRGRRRSSKKSSDELAGVIFVVDAASADISASLSSSSSSTSYSASADKSSGGGRSAGVDRKGSSSLNDAASYLHDLLLILQRKENIPVLIAANKADLFTAVPVSAAKAALEREITAVRRARASGLLDSAVGADDAANEDWLGDEDDKNQDFSFEQLRDVDVPVEVLAGNVIGSDGPGIDGWWGWIAAQM